MKLVAEILTGALFYVEVEENSTVGDLKKVIGNQENLPSNRLILFLNVDQRNSLLENDEVSLKEYEVQDGSHIYLFFKPLDDCVPPISPSTPQCSVPNEPSPSNSC
ncbi:Ubiquitin-like protein [Handroanthus impetiginosus]|uniref:Ubiquitin-like protein n=1 Tax=Handroanthus impetiginosus TaxID=429701 RepID=A0A2G9G2G1_9LAMI|nr:Ubiquitin-like protein [Handroanthus impetiginosus]